MYNTPELRLVGAAQTLVLGQSPALAGSLVQCEFGDPADPREGEEDYQDLPHW